MIYVYDIILNWIDEDVVYEFFEWELNDDLEHIKRIPLFKVESKRLDDLLDYDFKIEKDFLEMLHNLTERYTSKSIEKISYACLFTDGSRTIAIEFDEKGNSIYRSKLLLDEEQEVEMISTKLSEYNFKIEKGRKRNSNSLTTRLENEIKKVLTIEIKDLYKRGNYDKLKYLYFECFGKEQENIDIAYKKLLDSIDKEVNYNHSKLYEVVKLSYQNK